MLVQDDMNSKQQFEHVFFFFFDGYNAVESC